MKVNSFNVSFGNFKPKQQNNSPKHINQPTAIILSDMDGTWLSKNETARKKLDIGVTKLIKQYSDKGLKVLLSYVTARPPGRLMKENPPTPDYSLTYNGGYIHQGFPTQNKEAMKAWEKEMDDANFDNKIVTNMALELAKEEKYSNLKIKTVGEVVGNLEADACKHISILCIENESINLADDESKENLDAKTFSTPAQVKDFIKDLETKVGKSGIQYNTEGPYPFSGKPYTMFDIAAPKANKGYAVNFLINELGINPENSIILGDGGNDISMMAGKDGESDGKNLVVVGNNIKLREKAMKMFNSPILVTPSKMPSSEGVLKGISIFLSHIYGNVENQAKSYLKQQDSDKRALAMGNYYGSNEVHNDNTGNSFKTNDDKSFEKVV